MNRSTALLGLAGLNMVDYITTVYLVKEGYDEKNPIVNVLMEKEYYDAVKIGVSYVFLMLAVVEDRMKIGKIGAIDYITLAVMVAYVVVVMNNILWIVHNLIEG